MAVLALFNVAFVLPLLAIVALLVLAGPRADPVLENCGAWLQRSWPVVLAGLLVLLGGGLAAVGAAGLIGQ